METTVTGSFPNRRAAAAAALRLVRAGFRTDQVRVGETHRSNGRQFGRNRPAYVGPGVALRACFGVVGGASAGALFAGGIGLTLAALVGVLLAAAGGAVLGIVFGGVPASMVQQGLGRPVDDGGGVLVSVTSDAARGAVASAMLVRAGGGGGASTAGILTAAALSPQLVAVPDQPAGRRQRCPSGS